MDELHERAALRWLERYITEGSPRVQHFAEITACLAKLDTGDGVAPLCTNTAREAGRDRRG